jgi:ribosomal protein S18 acetylase RimI-like enzyme
MDYTIRNATNNDIFFLTEAIIAAEKSNSSKLSLATLFNLEDSNACAYINKILQEEIDGCEFSISSFLIAECEGKPVGAIAGWVEGLNGEISSHILKSNLIGYVFNKNDIKNLKSNAPIVEGLLLAREKFALQIEYVFVHKDYHGRKIAKELIKNHIENAMKVYSELKKVQVQVFSNNYAAVSLYKAMGFDIVKVVKSNHAQVFNYLPYDEKLLMEKKINYGKESN